VDRIGDRCLNQVRILRAAARPRYCVDILVTEFAGPLLLEKLGFIPSGVRPPPDISIGEIPVDR